MHHKTSCHSSFYLLLLLVLMGHTTLFSVALENSKIRTEQTLKPPTLLTNTKFTNLQKKIGYHSIPIQLFIMCNVP